MFQSYFMSLVFENNAGLSYLCVSFLAPTCKLIIPFFVIQLIYHFLLLIIFLMTFKLICVCFDPSKNSEDSCMGKNARRVFTRVRMQILTRHVIYWRYKISILQIQISICIIKYIRSYHHDIFKQRMHDIQNEIASLYSHIRTNITYLVKKNVPEMVLISKITNLDNLSFTQIIITIYRISLFII